MNKHLSQVVLTGMDIAASIDRSASHLMSLMKQVHGGEWRIHVDHESRFVMIAAAGDRAVVAPKRGELV